MATRREWLAAQGLAQLGRGRFSREAKAALASAIERGVTFTDDPAVPVRKEKVVKPVIVKPERPGDFDAKAVRSWANQVGYNLGQRGRLPENVILEYLSLHQSPQTKVRVKPERRPVRDETVAFGIIRRRDDEPDYFSEPVLEIASCGGCGDTVQFCACPTGPQLPRWLGGGPALLVAP